MRRVTLRVAALLIGTVVTAFGAATPAVAATAPPPGEGPHGHIVQLDTRDGQLKVLFSAVGLTDGQSIDPSSVHLSLNGAAVEGTATPLTSSPAPATVRRAAVLVIDVSGSMRGAGLDGAKQAARAFLDAVPADVLVGLVRVSTKADLTVAPTTDRGAIRSAVDALTAGGDTALYDGTELALRAVGDVGSRTVVLLTDGHDDGSVASLDDVMAKARASDAVVDAVSFGTAAAQVEPLRQITAATGGRVVATDRADDIAKVFKEAAHDIATQVLVTATVPERFAGHSVTVAVTASVSGSGTSATVPIDDRAFIPLPAAPAAPAAPSQHGPVPVAVDVAATASHTALYIGLGGLFVALLVGLGLAASAAGSRDRPETRVRRRLSFYTLTGREPRTQRQPTALGDSSLVRSVVGLAGRVAGSHDIEAKLGRRLEAAGVPLKPAEWLVVQAGATLGVGLVFLLLSRGHVLPLLFGLLLGAAAPVGYLGLKESRRTTAFLGQLPDTLQLIAGSLSVGHSLPHALDAVVREASAPVSTEFNRALVENRLGMAIDDALDGIAQRMDSKDFAWVVMAIRIQREVGGNLAEILTTVASTLRDRERLRRQVKVLSAEGRLSAWILGCLPPAFASYLVVVRPGYIRPLFTDPLGVTMLATGIAAMAIGVLWLRKVVRVEV